MKKKPSKKHYIKGIFDIEILARELRTRHGVESFYIGKRIRKGRRTDETCLCCVVSRKEKLGNRDPRRVRRDFKYEASGRKQSIRTDIVEADLDKMETSSITSSDLVADSLSPFGGSSIRATIGAYAHHPQDGEIFITAGHFAKDIGGDYATAYCHDYSGHVAPVLGVVLRWMVTDDADYAIVRPKPGAAPYGNGEITHGYSVALDSDLNETYFAATYDQWIPTRLVGVGVTSNSGWRDMIQTESVLELGDSGCALVDKHSRLVGILRGINIGRGSYFTPIEKIAYYENFKLRG